MQDSLKSKSYAKTPFVIDFLNKMYYFMYSWCIKPYHLLVSPPVDVPAGISYSPPLTDPF